MLWCLKNAANQREPLSEKNALSNEQLLFVKFLKYSSRFT